MLRLALVWATDRLDCFFLYKPDQYQLSAQDKVKLDAFLLQNWDRLTIHGYTDETEGEEYNLELSRKRSDQVFQYCVAKKVPAESINTQYFGESVQLGDYTTREGRAINRRTTLVGFRFPRVAVKPKEAKADPMIPVTKTLDNGFIITYQPGGIPEYLAANFAAGTGMNFQLLTNTVETRRNNLYNNTTNGEILSSVLIICGTQAGPCKLDSPILMKVPIPFKTKCPIEKVKFFNAVAENGKRIWQEQSKDLFPEEINGVQYIRLWMDDFCGCINFDFKVDPDCFDTDSTRVFYTNGTIKNLTTELEGLNSVYLPRKINDSTHSVVFIKDQAHNASLSFRLLHNRRNVRSFRNVPVTTLPYDSAASQYRLSTGTVRIYFPKQKVEQFMLKVNTDKYRVYPDGNKLELVYLNRHDEKIHIDFSVKGRRGYQMPVSNLSLDSIPYDAAKGAYIIDKAFLKNLREKRSMSATAAR